MNNVWQKIHNCDHVNQSFFFFAHRQVGSYSILNCLDRSFVHYKKLFPASEFKLDKRVKIYTVDRLKENN
jgi:hypothetical protein